MIGCCSGCVCGFCYGACCLFVLDMFVFLVMLDFVDCVSGVDYLLLFSLLLLVLFGCIFVCVCICGVALLVWYGCVFA